MMRAFANLFLLLFLADGGVSLVDEFTSLFAPVPPLDALRHLLAVSVIILADLIYLGLAIDRRLPKRLFLPLIAFLFISPLLTWVFPPLGASHLYGVVTALLQILLLLLVTKPFWKRGDTFTLPPEIFTGPSFSLKNSLAFGAANLLVVPLALVVVGLMSADAVMREYTSGFMHLGPDGLHMAEKVYRRQNQTIRLAGMIHIGEKDYYDKVIGAANPGRSTIVLAEGVSDSQNLLRNRPDYGKLAGYLGLSSQQDKLHFKGREIESEDERQDGGHGGVDILRADVDISSFSPKTIWFLNELGRQTKNSGTLSRQLLESVAWSEKNVTPEMQRDIMEDILRHRNEVLIGHLKRALQHYDNVVIPWGALHMAGIEQEVLKEGFRLEQVRDSVSIRFFRKSVEGGGKR